MGLYSIRDFDRGGILSEAYVPKSKELKKAEALLDQLRTPYLTKDSSGLTGVVKDNDSIMQSLEDNARRAEEKFAEKINSIGRLIRNK